MKQKKHFLFLFPSNELGNIQHEAPNNNFAKPLAWGSQQPQPLLVVLRRGFNPIPRPFPYPGEGMQPLASARSVTKVSATHQRVAGRFPTQQSCDCLCSLRSPPCEKPSNFGSCRDCLCGFRPRLLQPCYMEALVPSAKPKFPNHIINTEAQRYRVFIILCVSVSLCCIYI